MATDKTAAAPQQLDMFSIFETEQPPRGSELVIPDVTLPQNDGLNVVLMADSVKPIVDPVQSAPDQDGAGGSDATIVAEESFHLPTAAVASRVKAPAWFKDKPRTKSQRVADNEAAKALLASLEAMPEFPIPRRVLDVLSGYSGDGGIGASLNEYYTPIGLSTEIWRLLGRHGMIKDRPSVLEPSAGPGAFVATVPAGASVVAYDINRTSIRILSHLMAPQRYLPAECDPEYRREAEDAATAAYVDLNKDKVTYGTPKVVAAFLGGARGEKNSTDNMSFQDMVDEAHAAGISWHRETYGYDPISPEARAGAMKAKIVELVTVVERLNEPDIADHSLLRGLLEAEIMDASASFFSYCEAHGLVGVDVEPANKSFLYEGKNEFRVGSFETFNVYHEHSQFDVVIGNPPFGLRGDLVGEDGSDIDTAQEYFLKRGIDRLAPGGCLAFILPASVMDGVKTRWLREYASTKTEFVTAFRLPSETFNDAGTSVVTDLLILRRRTDPLVAEVIAAAGPAAALESGIFDKAFISGDYFVQNPSQVLGRMKLGWRAEAGMGNDIAVDGSLPDALRTLSTADFSARLGAPTSHDDLVRLLGDAAVRKGRANLEKNLTAFSAPDALPESLAPSVEASFALGRGIAALLEKSAGQRTDSEIEAVRVLAENYVREYGHPISNKELSSWRKKPFLSQSRAAEIDSAARTADESAAVLKAEQARSLSKLAGLAIGAFKDEGGLSDLLAGASPSKPALGLNAAIDRLAIDGDEFEWDDVVRLAGEGSVPADAVPMDILFASGACEPVGGGMWVGRDMFYSGNLWPRLDNATIVSLDLGEPEAIRIRAAAQIAELERLIDPVLLETVEISFTAGFITPEDIAGWLTHRVRSGIERSYRQTSVAMEAAPKVEFDGGFYKLTPDEPEKRTSWTCETLAKHLNRTGLREEDRKKIELWEAEFAEWVKSGPHREQIERRYNRSYRGVVPLQLSSTPIDIIGLNSSRGVNDYHWPMLRWGLKTKRGIIAADVGLGKTTFAALANAVIRQAQEAGKIGIVAPKSVLAKWRNEILAWFPEASVFVIGETVTPGKKGKDGKPKSKTDSREECRRKFQVVRQSTFDFVLMSGEAWGMLDLGPIAKHEMIQKDFWSIRGEALGQEGDKRKTKAEEAFLQACAKRESGVRDDTIYFEDVGFDGMIIDEFHRYKNLFSPKNRFGQSPKFLGGGGLSNRAFDTYLKLQHMVLNNSEAVALGLTATPTKNSPLEVYSALVPLVPEAFTSRGILNSETFLDRFCEFAEEPVLNMQGMMERSVAVTGFKNMDELRQIIAQSVYRITAADVGLKIPKEVRQDQFVEMTDRQKEVYEGIRQRMLEAQSKRDAQGDDHVFSALDKMAKASVDLTLLDPVYVGERSPKIDALVETIVAALNDPADESNHIVFCDHVQVHEKIREALIARGVPADIVRVVNGKTAPTSEDRLNVSDDFNSGLFKVMVSNGPTAGEGMDLQAMTGHVHHMDLPWDADSLHQRNGRAFRQGNSRESAVIHTYFAKGSNDAYRYQNLAAKRTWQDMIWKSTDKVVDNLARTNAISKIDLLIMLSPDPEAARAKYEADMASATTRHEQNKRSAFLATYLSFTEMQRNIASAPSVDEKSAMRRERRLESLRASLMTTPWFERRDLIENDIKFAIDPSTGIVLAPGDVILVGKADEEGSELKIRVVDDVSVDADSVKLRRYAHAGEPSHENRWQKVAEVAKLGISPAPSNFTIEAEIVEFEKRLHNADSRYEALPFWGDSGSKRPPYSEKEAYKVYTSCLPPISSMSGLATFGEQFVEKNRSLINRMIDVGESAHASIAYVGVSGADYSTGFDKYRFLEDTKGRFILSAKYNNERPEGYSHFIPTNEALERLLLCGISMAPDVYIGSSSQKTGKEYETLPCRSWPLHVSWWNAKDTGIPRTGPELYRDPDVRDDPFVMAFQAVGREDLVKRYDAAVQMAVVEAALRARNPADMLRAFAIMMRRETKDNRMNLPQEAMVALAEIAITSRYGVFDQEIDPKRCSIETIKTLKNYGPLWKGQAVDTSLTLRWFLNRKAAASGYARVTELCNGIEVTPEMMLSAQMLEKRATEGASVSPQVRQPGPERTISRSQSPSFGS